MLSEAKHLVALTDQRRSQMLRFTQHDMVLADGLPDLVCQSSPSARLRSE